MAERIELIYKKESHKKLKLILESLYARYQRLKNEYISVSELATKIEKDLSNTRKVLIKMEKEGIVDAKYSENAKGKTRGGRTKKSYRLSQEAYDIIKETKTAK